MRASAGVVAVQLTLLGRRGLAALESWGHARAEQLHARDAQHLQHPYRTVALRAQAISIRQQLPEDR